MHDSHSSPGNLLAQSQQQHQHQQHQQQQPVSQQQVPSIPPQTHLHHPIPHQFAPASSSFAPPDAFSSLFAPTHFPGNSGATTATRALPIKNEGDGKPYSNAAGFVHRLYDMVEDRQYQHLISWNYPGTTFVVCNVVEFAKDVLPKHYKHNNFSSFVRQLNMYGFRKVSKSPRGHKTSPESQIWEFSHPRFQRGRSDLLDDIKRKQGDSLDVGRTPVGDVPAGVAMLQISQTDLMQRVNSLQDTLSEVLRDLHETKQRQAAQQDIIKKMREFMEGQGFQFDRFEVGYALSPQNGYSSGMVGGGGASNTGGGGVGGEVQMNRHRQSYVRGSMGSPQHSMLGFSSQQQQQQQGYLFQVSSRLVPQEKCGGDGERHDEEGGGKKRKYDTSPKTTAAPAYFAM